MRLLLTWVEVDRGNNVLNCREEMLVGDSERSLTKLSAKKLIQKAYPDKRVSMTDSYRPPHRWCAVVEQVNKNNWRYIYADPIELDKSQTSLSTQ